jgi:hypothetical protein
MSLDLLTPLFSQLTVDLLTRYHCLSTFTPDFIDIDDQNRGLSVLPSYRDHTVSHALVIAKAHCPSGDIDILLGPLLAYYNYCKILHPIVVY